MRRGLAFHERQPVAVLSGRFISDFIHRTVNEEQPQAALFSAGERRVPVGTSYFPRGEWTAAILEDDGQLSPDRVDAAGDLTPAFSPISVIDDIGAGFIDRQLGGIRVLAVQPSLPGGLRDKRADFRQACIAARENGCLCHG